jgi:hypothetical protein
MSKNGLGGEIMNKKITTRNKYRNTKSWNPFVGCSFGCIYCKPSFQNLIAWIGRMRRCIFCQKYIPHGHLERLTRIPREKAIFVCEDGDLSFATDEFVRQILEAMNQDQREDRLWFLQSKNPKCFQKYLEMLPENTYLLTTLETNRGDGYGEISKAPKPSQRYNDFLNLNWDKKLITIEPVLDFDLDAFVDWIVNIKPKAVFIGYNSYPNTVPLLEPYRKKTWQLIHTLEGKGIKVFKKEMRDKRVTKKAYRDFAEN